MLTVSVVGLATYFLFGWAKAWMPNIVVGAATVALTVTVIERALRAELEQRFVERRLPARWLIGIATREFARLVRSDYLATHTAGTRIQPSLEVVPLLELWLSSQSSEDTPRSHEQRVALAEAGLGALREIDEVRRHDADVLPADVVSAIDRLDAALGNVAGILAHTNRAIHLADGTVLGPEVLEGQAQVDTVEAFRAFAADIVRYIPEAKLAPSR
jgi:hypothetical protein